MVVLKQEVMHIFNVLFLSHKGQDVQSKNDVFVPDSIRLLTSSGNVLLCEFDNKPKYVRLIREHSSLKQYVDESIDLFFDLCITDETIAAYREKAHADLRRRENFAKIKKLEPTVQQNVKKLASREFVEVSLFGFPSLFEEAFYPVASAFILFLRGEMTAYRDNQKLFSRGAYLQTFNYNLQWATKRLSDLLGIGELIPDIAMQVIEIKHKRYVASVMEPSPGVTANEVAMERRRDLTPPFIRCLSNLDYLDSLCYQTDHKQRNYNICWGPDDKPAGVSAFDNDAPLTFLPVPAFPQKVSLMDGYTPVYKNGKIGRRFMDRLLADRLCSLTKKQVFEALTGSLTRLQVFCVWFRMQKLRNAIKQYRNENSSFLMDFRDDTDVSSFVEDANSVAGMDYLTYFQTNNEKERYKHIKI